MGTIGGRQIRRLYETKQPPLEYAVCVMSICDDEFVSDAGSFVLRIPLHDSRDLAVVREHLKRSIFMLNKHKISEVIVLEPLASLIQQVLADDKVSLRKWHYNYINEKFRFKQD